MRPRDRYSQSDPTVRTIAQDIARRGLAAQAEEESGLRIHVRVQRRVIISIHRLSESLNVSITTVTTGLRRLGELNIVRETTGRKYGRMFAYQKQLDILNDTGG